MRPQELCIVLTFYTTADAMAMEKFCHSHGLMGRLIPIPRTLSAGCGMAWKLPKKEADSLFFESIDHSGIEIEQIVEMNL